MEELGFIYDRRFNDLYGNLQTGKIKQAFTRLHVDEIASGFYRRVGKNTELVSNLKADRPGREALLDFLRRGNRPQLLVYWSPIAPGKSKYVCPDDENMLQAYKDLRIYMVPCSIMRPATHKLKEASIWFGLANGVVTYDRAISPAISGLVSFRFDPDITFEVLVGTLVEECKKLRAAVREFHLSDREGLSYHQMLHALLLRHERTLDSISRLVSLGRVEHAFAIVRVTYEAFLNFYVDWISPTYFGPRMQLLSAIRYLEASRMDPDEKLKARSELKSLGKFERLLEVTAEKARISPLGSAFHDLVYPPLSLVAHQSYGTLELEAVDFSDTAPAEARQSAKQLGVWLNAITTALVQKAGNEVGYLGL